jgi:hypothetical protein
LTGYLRGLAERDGVEVAEYAEGYFAWEERERVDADEDVESFLEV